MSDLALFEVAWTCRGATGTRQVWAHDPDEACEHLREHASLYGLPHERPLVGMPVRLDFPKDGDLNGIAA